MFYFLIAWGMETELSIDSYQENKIYFYPFQKNLKKNNLQLKRK